jgi:tetratricopeptide (TPR) repeat protein
LDRPDGLVEYAAAFLAQLNYYNWLGALIFTALNALIFLAANGLCLQALGRGKILIGLAPALALLAWRGRYEGHALAASLEIVVSLGGALACAKMARRPTWLRWLVCWIVGAALYYSAGLWPLLLFLLLTGCCEAIPKRKWLSAALLVLPPLLWPVIWPGLPWPQKLLNPWGVGWPLLGATLSFLLVPSGLIILALLPRLKPMAKLPAPQPARPRAARAKSGSAAASWPAWQEPALAIGGLLLGWALVWFSLDEFQRSLARIEYYAATKQDEPLLKVAARMKTTRPDAEARTHLALYHTGRLTQDLFSFPNGGRGILLPGLTFGVGAARSEMDTMFELGQVNEAEHMAQESLEFDGDRPDVLRVLAKINVIKGRPQAAEVFLHALCQIPFQGDWAKARLAQLQTNPQLSGDTELDQVRARMPNTDFPHSGISSVAEDMLRQLLAFNPRNQMAFEYLMAHYLMTGEIKRLAQQLGPLDTFAYPAIPRHIEEAILLGQEQGLHFDLHGRTISEATRQRFQNFRETLSHLEGKNPSAVLSLARDFGDTFWYYYLVRQAKGT